MFPHNLHVWNTKVAQPGLWNPEETSPEVQNKDIRPNKKDLCPSKILKIKKQNKYICCYFSDNMHDGRTVFDMYACNIRQNTTVQSTTNRTIMRHLTNPATDGGSLVFEYWHGKDFFSFHY